MPTITGMTLAEKNEALIARIHSNNLFFMMVFLPSLFFISQIVKALSENRISGGTRLSMLNNI
ncbi:MAG TPA: hypothetical protein DCX37_00960 [Firmicutes bacterium]|jgi:hypothetical protein|nr:hypothetical protein [Bacillota bacterium]